MEIKYTVGQNGYDIPYMSRIRDEEKILIVSHGFGSSLKSPTAQMLLDGMPNHGIGVIAYDFPNHGASKAGPDGLRIENCISDLETIEQMMIKENPKAEIMYFSSSFGAYIDLLYLSMKKHTGTKSFLRSAAVNMPELFMDPTDVQRETIDRDGRLTLSYEQPLTITAEFVNDMLSHDLFELYRPGKTKVEMIHGEKDATIDPEKAKRFAEKFSIPVTMVPKGGHRLMEDAQPQMVFDAALKMFSERGSSL
ncbi:MAG: alpha/beta hydrolase [Eubacteriaceae bacterium]|nr:alpha/beta hydrolase [Eubacteriaceae bacterium]